MQTQKQIDPSEIVVSLDIGTTKVCAVIGRQNEYGKVEILGMGKVASEGVLRGVVSNIDKTVKAISEAVKIANRGLNLEINEVYVGIAGQHIKSLQHRGILTRDDLTSEISQADIQKLIDDMHKLVLPPGDRILHVIPQEYTVDNEQGIVDPVGMSGRRLEANFHIITGQISAANNILRCVKKAGYAVADITLEPIASAASVLSNEEKEAGIALVDIGGGTTDVTVFYDGIIRHTAVIPFGGNVVTKDIKEGCTVMNDQAEKLKVKFGSALAEEVVDNRIITIPGLKGREPKEISEKNLALIIQARLIEILDLVAWELKKSGCQQKLIGGIVLTGGGSLLKYMDLLSQYHMGMGARIGLPVEHLAHGYMEHISSPIYATSIGLLIHGIQIESLKDKPKILRPSVVETEKITPVVSQKIERPKPKNDEGKIEKRQPVAAGAEDSKWFHMFLNKTKEFFEPTPDSELY